MATTHRYPHPIVVALRAERERRGLHQKDIAAAIGASRNAVWGWENASTDIPLDRLIAYAKALGYTLTLTPKETSTDA